MWWYIFSSTGIIFVLGGSIYGLKTKKEKIGLVSCLYGGCLLLIGMIINM